jgi:uncharacterized protein (UPF0332 family)
MLDREPGAYLAKARQNLAAAELALRSGHYDACCSRTYYAAFQAALAALWVEGIRPVREADRTLSHAAVKGEWAGRLVYRRKLYPAELRVMLERLYEWRLKADYGTEHVPERTARGAVLRARQLVTSVEQKLQPPGEP